MYQVYMYPLPLNGVRRSIGSDSGMDVTTNTLLIRFAKKITRKQVLRDRL